MNRVPCLLAKTVVHSGGSALPVAIGIGVAVLVIGGVIWLCYGQGKRRTVKRRSVVLNDEYLPNCRERQEEPSSDAEIARRLSGANRGCLPAGISDGFQFSGEWLREDLLSKMLEGDNRRCDDFLAEVIAKSNGRYVAAATVGEAFSRKRMHTRAELPDDGIIRLVKRRGLVRVEDGCVLMNAEVE